MFRNAACVAAVALIALFQGPVLGDLFEDIYQGLGYYAMPIGSASSALSNGARLGRVRVVPNRLGGGYRIELDRNFGNDQFGRPEVFDLGAYELQLQGNTQATFGYTSRGFLVGNADVFANNLRYTLRAKTGLQDLEIEGVLDVSSRMEVNALGFYTLDFEINNTDSKITLDGVVVDGDMDTDWDVGPISIKGNIFYDAAMSILTGLGFDTSGAEALFPGSPVGILNQRLAEAVGNQARVASELVINTAGANISEQSAMQARELVNEFAAQSAQTEPFGPPSPYDGGQLTPEPAAVALLLVGGLLAASRRR